GGHATGGGRVTGGGERQGVAAALDAGRGRLAPGGSASVAEAAAADGAEGAGAGAGGAAGSSAEAGCGGSALGESASVDAAVAFGGDGSAPLDPDLAARFLGVLADRIAVGVASVVAVLDPGCVVLGGEVGQAGGAVLARLVQERLRRMSPLATEVRASSLGGTAVLRGALLTARERAQDELFAPPERH
ncbi:ROK family protein, partial [Streptomyces sp. 900105245]